MAEGASGAVAEESGIAGKAGPGGMTAGIAGASGTSAPTLAARPPGAPTWSAGEAHPLDNPIWSALTGPHAGFAETVGRAARYPDDVAPFVAMDGADGAWPWDDLADLLGPGGPAVLFAVHDDAPAGWRTEQRMELVQLVATDALADGPAPEARLLGPADVPAMLDLVARTRPGPFRPRTIELGTYLGIEHDGALVAMAGERLHLPGMTEISAVCTDDAHRGRGLASRLVRAVTAGIRARGEVPFLHAAGSNTTAIRLYEQLGFTVRHRGEVQLVHAPGVPGPRAAGDAQAG